MRASLAVLAVAALWPSVSLAQRRGAAETVVAEMAARAPERLVVGDWVVRLPEAVPAGFPCVVRLEGGALRYAVHFTVRAEAADGSHVEGAASYDPADDREPPGCDPMPGDRSPCSRVVPPPGAVAVLRGAAFARVGEVHVVVHTSERGGGAAEVTGRVRVVAPELAVALTAIPYSGDLRGRATVRFAPYPRAAPLVASRAELRVNGRDVDVDVSEPVADAAVLERWLHALRWTPSADFGPSVRVSATDGHTELSWVSAGRIVRIRSSVLGAEERALAAQWLERHPPDGAAVEGPALRAEPQRR